MGKYIAALMLASTLIAAEASATVTLTNMAVGKRNDLDITFNNPPGPLRQTITGDPFVELPGSDKKTVVSSGWSVNALGSTGNTITIEGLEILKKGGKGPGNSQVVSWCFSLDGVCPKDDPALTVNFDGADITLKMLNDDGYGVYSLPEPTSWLTMMCGFVALGAVLRRRRQALSQVRT